MLCQTCTTKQVVHGLGFCRKCAGVTTSSMYMLCDTCATQLQECKGCRTPMGSTSGSSTVPSGPTPFTVKVGDKDNGATISGIRVGERIEVELSEDQYSGKEWAVKSYDRYRFSLTQSGQFKQDPSDPQYGTRTFVFSCTGNGQGTIEFYEVQRSYGYWWGGGGGTTPVPNGQQWSAKFDVK